MISYVSRLSVEPEFRIIIPILPKMKTHCRPLPIMERSATTLSAPQSPVPVAVLVVDGIIRVDLLGFGCTKAGQSVLVILGACIVPEKCFVHLRSRLSAGHEKRSSAIEASSIAIMDPKGQSH